MFSELRSMPQTPPCQLQSASSTSRSTDTYHLSSSRYTTATLASPPSQGSAPRVRDCALRFIRTQPTFGTQSRLLRIFTSSGIVNDSRLTPLTLKRGNPASLPHLPSRIRREKCANADARGNAPELRTMGNDSSRNHSWPSFVLSRVNRGPKSNCETPGLSLSPTSKRLYSRIWSASNSL